MESASIAAGGAPLAHDDHHHGPPEAHQSSRIDRQTLGILLFIISEVMLFGAFFASYFFIRVVANDGAWPPDGFELPVGVAGVNTAILISSSFTIHWALESVRSGNRRGDEDGPGRDLAARRDLPLHPDQRVRPHRLQRFATAPSARSSTASPACTAPTSSSACCCSPSPTSAPGVATSGPKAKDHLGVEVPGIYWHFVDVMWIIVYTTVYIL